MSNGPAKKIGLLIGREWSWPSAFITEVNKRNAAVTAEFVKLGGTFLDQAVEYDVIIDRMSHEIPYYRVFLKAAALQGVYVINNPFTWAGDDRFLGIALAHRLGIETPRTVALPNKRVETQVVPESFRNLDYPMNWRGIIDYVGVPAILKDADARGSKPSQRVYDVDDLIQKYDESDTLTMIVQEIVEPGEHVHVFVVGQEQTLAVRYSVEQASYLPDLGELDEATVAQMKEEAVAMSRAYGYDINLVEFIVRDGVPVVINPTNPAPDMDINLLKPGHFSWCVNAVADWAVHVAEGSPKEMPQGAWQDTGPVSPR
jgi:glutathione synthase/RimK-type ligase-like ATP-grasp enzyme